MDTLIFLNTLLCQKFQLCIQRSLVPPGDLRDLIKELRLKTDACLYFICRHTNTPYAK